MGKKGPAPFSNLNFFVKNRQFFFAIELMNIHSFSREKVLRFFDEEIEIRERFG